MSLRLGLVPYSNMLPLIHDLDQNRYPEDLRVRATPGELADLMADRKVDIAALSTFEGLKNSSNYALIPEMGIGSQGAVKSVKLFSHVPVQKVESILLDTASLTSINLIRILATELLGITPEYLNSDAPLSPDDIKNEMTEGTKGIVTIGETALSIEQHFPYSLDLGQGWMDLTGLPFVFAAWFVHKDLTLDQEDVNALYKAKLSGLANLDQIAEATGGGEETRAYFSNHLHYHLAGIELESIDLFRRKLINHGLLDFATPPIELKEPFPIKD